MLVYPDRKGRGGGREERFECALLEILRGPGTLVLSLTTIKARANRGDFDGNRALGRTHDYEYISGRKSKDNCSWEGPNVVSFRGSADSAERGADKIVRLKSTAKNSDPERVVADQFVNSTK